MKTSDPGIAVSVLIVSYNTAEATSDCLRSVMEGSEGTPREVIVVDNASTDGSAGVVAGRFPGVRVICLEENIGFGRACNRAAEEARGELLLLLNPDTLVLDDAISEIVRGARVHPQAGLWGGRTLNPDGSVATETCSRFPTLWTTFCRVAGLSGLFRRSDIFNRETYGGWKRDGVREVEVISGCWLLIRRELWDRLEGFDPVFFMYSEEVDLCLRARAVGARPLFLPAAEITHFRGLSEPTRSRRLGLLLKGKVTFMRLHWPPLRRRIGIALLTIWPLSRTLGFSALGRLTGNAVLRARARDWRGVWRARRDWTRGYRR